MRIEWKNLAGRFVGLAAMASLWAGICPAQSRSEKSSAAQPPAALQSKETRPDSSAKKKPALADWMRTSTAEEARRAEEEASNRKQEKKAESVTPKSDPVMELQTVSSGSAPLVVESGRPKGGVLKNIHGEVYGANGSPGSAEGGNIGASTKGGKLDIYLEAHHAKTDASGPR